MNNSAHVLIESIHKGNWGEIAEAELSSLSLPPLYKISGTGKVLQWEVYVHECCSGNGYQIHMLHGQQGGKEQRDIETITEGKNIGRSNETTPQQQAAFQAVARWKKQHDRGYRETIEEAQKAAKAAHSPMLAHKYTDKVHTLKKGEKVALQPKLDGMRCVASNEAENVTLRSRAGKEITSVPHIQDELSLCMPEGSTWDGELYSHSMDFETTMSVARKKKPDPRHEEL